MRNFVLLFATLLVVPILGKSATNPESPFRTDLTFNAALKEAGASKKVVFVDFYTTWCEPCKKLDETTWKDADAVALLATKTIALRIDAEKEKDLAAKYSVTAYPTLAVIRPDGTLVDSLVGYRDAPTFIGEVTAMLAGKSMLDLAKDAVRRAEGDPQALAKARMGLGRQYALKGMNAEALTEYLWCFDSGMKAAPSYAGVRLSFLLNDIVSLGANYQPAKDALKKRLAAAKAAAAGDPAAAAEFGALANALGETKEMVSVYESLPADAAGRITLGSIAFEAYLKAKDYKQAVAAVPLDKFQARMGPLAGMASSQASVMQYLNMASANEIEALAGAGDLDGARQLIKDTLARDSSQPTLDLVKTHLAAVGKPELLAEQQAASSDTSDVKTVPGLEKSIVKIFVTSRGPEVYKPWTKGAPKDTTASGVVIDGKLILTTARAVAYSNQIEIQANQSGDKIPATIALLNWAMNLAVLKLDDESFFDTHSAVPFEQGLPSIKDPILVYGFPVGGSTLSITKGIISRIEFGGGGWPDYELRIQIDAAINEGNSGGPAVAGGKIVGLALGRLNHAENIGYIIPNEEIALFLRDLPAGKPTRDPAFYDFWQTLENADLRKSLGLTKDVEGIVIQEVADKDPNYPLKQWDVIEKVGTYPVDDQGMVHVGALRLDFRYAVRKEAKAGHIGMLVLRRGKTQAIDVPLGFRHMLVPGVEGLYPPYFILGPIAFTKATQALAVGIMESKPLLGGMTWDRSPIIERRGDTVAFPDEELVVVPSPFFPNKLAVGYRPPFPHTVATVNGIPVKNLKHLVEILRDAKTDYITIRFAERYKEALVFSRAELVSSTDSILADNGIRSQGSAELMSIWNAKPTP